MLLRAIMVLIAASLLSAVFSVKTVHDREEGKFHNSKGTRNFFVPKRGTLKLLPRARRTGTIEWEKAFPHARSPPIPYRDRFLSIFVFS